MGDRTQKSLDILTYQTPLTHFLDPFFPCSPILIPIVGFLLILTLDYTA